MSDWVGANSFAWIWDTLALVRENGFLVSSRQSLLPWGWGGEPTITRSNYPPSAAFLAAVVKALAKTLLHQYRDPKSPKSQGEGSASPRSRKTAQHQDLGARGQFSELQRDSPLELL